MLYLAPYVSTIDYAGRTKWLPRGVAGIDGWARLPLHEKGKSPGVDDRCLVWTPDASPIVGEGSRVSQISADKGEGLSRTVATRLEADLAVSLADDHDGAAMLKRLLFGRQETRWNGVIPTHDNRKQVWLNGVLWAEETVERSRELGIDPTDDFNRANETPIAAPWTQQSGSGGTINLASNAVTAGSAADKFYYYSGATATANQFSQWVSNSSVTNDDWGPAVRIGENGFSGYWFSQYTAGSEEILCYDGGSFSSILALDISNLTNGQTVYIEANGSSITCKKNGATVMGPTTDTLLTAAGNGVGVFLYQTGGAIDTWQGGDIGGAAATSLIWNKRSAMRAMLKR